MNRGTSLGVLLVLLACGGCTPQRVELRFQARQLEAPAAAGSGEPNLAVAPDGRVLLSWIEPAGESQHSLRFASRPKAGAWSKPETIASGPGWFVNWADFPSLAALPDGTLFAHWLVKSGAGTFAYDVRVTSSRDGGMSWSEPVTPHRDGTQTEHGFVSMIPASGEAMGLVWLDGRRTAGLGHQGHGAAHAEMALLHSTVDREGRLGTETTLDGRVCDCCQTDAAVAEGAIVVVYRDRSEKEVRDMSFVRLVDGKWSEPRPLARDGWEINGCPVNGPAVAASDQQVAAAWFTAAHEQSRVNVAFSADSGATFGPPVAVDDGRPLGRVDVVFVAKGVALVSWLEQAQKGTELRVRQVLPDGTRGEALTLADSNSARSSGFPRMAVSGGEVILAWRDVAEPPRVRTAVVTWAGSE
ncbi:MAG TPA: sialidase family protein [Vicinamibacteria bacterium]|nr:sialidase family protein [Vicinamibacteria bacterium]